VINNFAQDKIQDKIQDTGVNFWRHSDSLWQQIQCLFGIHKKGNWL
jgi:hypothetical protein